MKKGTPNKLLQRLGALALALVLMLGALPADTFAAPGDLSRVVGEVQTIADPDTVSRPADVYGDNTLNAGKITVGKSVSDKPVTLTYGGNSKTFTPSAGNFIITSSQASQVLGLATEQTVPVDVMFVLDTSGSMDATDDDYTDRAHEMVTAANDAIATLMAANPLNRVGVVAFSSRSGDIPSAQVLSQLASYTGNAATAHLQWVTSDGGTTGNNRGYIAGRSITGQIGSARREGHEGGTNIHAGVALGGQQLMNTATTTATLADGTVVTRMPFLVILSDGQPTYIAGDENGSTWYNPSYNNNLGDGSNPYEGAGFMVALTAAYYKGKITERYYGSTASSTNRCNIYTLGVQLEKLSGNNKALAQITMNPKEYTTGSYAADGAASYWNYGNTHSQNNNKSTTHGWKTYWDAYNAATATSYPVRVDTGSGKLWIGQGPEGTGAPAVPNEPREWDYYKYINNRWQVDREAYNAAVAEYNAAKAVYDQWEAANYMTVDYKPYFITAESITATKDYVDGVGYTGGIAYNDGYYSTDGTGGSLSSAFEQIVTQIQKQALASPTHVNAAHGADFSGYVTYTDPIGEYMEVKNIRGVLVNGKLYEGKSFAYWMENWDSAPSAFKTEFAAVLQERCKVTESQMNVNAYIQNAVDSQYQAYYKGDTDYDNSLVWWGQEYTVAGKEDLQVKWMGFADDDSFAYVSTTTPPAGATHVCRSYYFYGAAGDMDTTPAEDLLHFVVRVQRSLTAPYQETVVISAPASMLSAEKVFVTEKTDSDGNKTYEAEVTPAEPARVVYEVGLRSDINAYNVEKIVGADTAYTGETAVLNGAATATNYANGKYTFYTNDWDRAAEENEHHRAMAKATFEAAATNSFYTYTQDTLIYSTPGTVYTGTNAPTGTVYYAREYYDWAGKTATNGVYPAEKKVEYIQVSLPAGAEMKRDGNNWYIPKGVYKASSLVAKDEDVYKTEGGLRVNPTQTAQTVAHPHRTTSAVDNHYTVLLGNNGRLTLTPEKTKSVYKNNDLTVEADGKVVKVGDTLTYQIKVVNPENGDATAEVTDTIPRGTTLAKDANDAYIISDGGTFDGEKITWNLNMTAGETKTVSFQVTVNTDLVNLVTIDNTAYVKLDNGFEYETNTTKNPPEGKRMVNTEGVEIKNGTQVQVQDILVYRILWQNDAGADATVTITDTIPTGTSYVEGSADHGGEYSVDATTGERKLTWTISAKAGNSGVVSFRVFVDASAGETIENEANIKVGQNDPRVTNKTNVTVKKADLVLSKEVKAQDQNSPAFTQPFELNITEARRIMNGTYQLFKGTEEVAAGITFTNGSAKLTIQHGETFTIKGLPVGAILSVTETAKDGYTPAYYVNGSADASDSEGRLTIADSNSVKVENTYAPIPASFQLSAKKVLETQATVQNTTFGFTAQACDANGVVKTGEGEELLTGEVTVSSATKEATVTFSPLTFAKTGTYYYLVDELDGGLAGVTYDPAQYLITIAVTDNGSGQLQAAATVTKRTGGSGTFADAQAAVFTNTYAPKATELVLTGNKTLTGRTLRENEFSFEVIDGATNKVVSTGYNKADGTIVFKPITYTQTGTHNYTVKEISGGLEGVTYSTAVFSVQVVVTDNAGQLNAAPNYNNNPIHFTNSFTPNDTRVVLNAQKSVVDKDGNAQTVQAEAFSFAVLDASGKTVATGKNAQGGAVTFSPIGYSLADLAGVDAVNGLREKTFTYTIKEVIPDLGADPYMDYDETAHTVTVKLSYNVNTGVLTATETYAGGAAPTFTNKQYPNSIEITPKAAKTTEGSVPAGSTFSFRVVNVATGKNAGTGVGAANGNVTFTQLSFSQPGTYKYWIQESHTGEHHGITYDATKYLLVVNVTLTNGKLEQTHAYYKLADGGDAANADSYTVAVETPSFHNKYDAKGQIALTARKVLNGRPLKDGEFGFTLIREGTNAGVSGVQTADGTITFANLYFDDEEFADGSTSKTIKYIMQEVIPTSAKVPGVTYDTNQYPVYVTITHNTQEATITAIVTNENGEVDVLNGGWAPNQTGVTFTNTYSVQTGATLTINANKKLTGRTMNAGEFSFALYHVVNGVENQVATATNDANGNFQFVRNYPATVLNGQSSRNIVYRIREIDGKLGGVTYDTSYEEFSVTITDNGQGGLTLSQNVITIGTEAAPAFQNSYAPTGVEFTPVAKKVLEHLTLRDNMFSFVVKDSNNKVVTTGESKADGTIAFAPIGYTVPGTYNYTISEVKGNLAGVQYTDTVYDLTVEVKDKLDGTMSATGTYKLNGATVAEQNVVFTNTFVPTDTSVQLKAKKVLTGRNMTAGEFSFVVKDENGEIVATGGNAAANIGTTAAVTFSNIGYQHQDLGQAASKTFNYTISELETSQGGVTFSEDVYYAKVTVTYNSTTGEMAASVKYYSDSNYTNEITEDQVKFTNKYAPTGTSLTLPVDKTLLNKQIKAGEFTFTLTNSNGQIVEEKTNDANGNVAFTALPFASPGVYQYTITERVTDSTKADLYTLDDPFTVIVTVKDDLQGKLIASAEYYVGYDPNKTNTNLGGVEFINQYTAPPITVPLTESIGATKALNGRTLTAGDKFTFKVYDIQNRVVSTGTNDSTGKITFEEFTFNQAGLYHYWIVEEPTTMGGVTIDSRVWELHVLVRYNEKNADLKVDGKKVEIGQLYVADEDVKTYIYSTGGTANTPSDPAFFNTYTPAPVDVTVEATKELTGRTMNNQEFLFQLIRSDGIVVGEARNDAHGKVTFNLRYTTAGERTYKLVEVNQGAAGITYDTTEFQVKVNVTDDLKGKLKAEVTYTTEPVFENTYTPAPAIVNLEAKKTYSGDKAYDGGIFKFKLENPDNANDPNNQTVENGTDGVAKFQLELTKPDTYTYTISEVAGTDTERFDYDTNSYDVTIVVTDDLAGQLVAEVAYNTTDAMAPVFVNKYKAEPVILALEGFKELTGRDLKAEEFSFVVHDSEGNQVATAKNAADGKLTFSNIKLSQVAEYILTVSEVKGDAQYVTYDETKYEVRVTVTNDNGVLKADVRYPETGVIFRNTYKVPETTQPTQPTQPGGSPDTGDHSNVFGFGTLAVLSLGMAMALVLLPKRKRSRG